MPEKELLIEETESQDSSSFAQRMMSKTSQDVLLDAKKVIAGARREAYGNARTSFTKIARLWSGSVGREVLAKDVALMMVLFKVARESNQHKRDNLVDLAGYAAYAATLHPE